MTRPLDPTTDYQQENIPISPELPEPKLMSSSQPDSVAIVVTTDRSKLGFVDELSGLKNWLHTPQNNVYAPNKLFWGGMLISLLLHLGILFIPLPTPVKKSQFYAKSDIPKVNLTSLPKKQELSPLTPSKKTQPRIKKEASFPSTKTFDQSKKIAPKIFQKSSALSQKITQSSPKNEPKIPPKATTKVPPLAEKTKVLAVDNWNDFPVYPNAQAGCFNLSACMQAHDDLNTVTSYFETELATNGYTYTSVLAESNQQVYQVSRHNRTEFLSFALKPELGTLYVLSDKLLDLGKLMQEIKAVKQGTTPARTSPNAASGDVDCQNFSQPELFCKDGVKRPEIDSIEWVEGWSADAVFDQVYRPIFDKAGSTITQEQNYGNGPVYSIIKGETHSYLNIVPNRENTGVFIVTWTSLPKPNVIPNPS